MQVILLDKVANLGSLGDQVNVKAGYARNFLVPQGKAVPATKKNIEFFEARRAELEAKLAEVLASEALRFPDSLLDLARQKLHAPAQAHNVLSPANHCAKPLPPPVHLYLDH